MIIWLSISNEVIDVQKIEFCKGDDMDEDAEIHIECSSESDPYHILDEEDLDDLKREWGLYSYEDVFNYIAEQLYKKGRVKIPV
jgi:hypothetical protein